jgi:hypothetical protein
MTCLETRTRKSMLQKFDSDSTFGGKLFPYHGLLWVRTRLKRAALGVFNNVPLHILLI